MLRRKSHKNVNILAALPIIIVCALTFCVLSNPIKIALFIPWALSGVLFILWRWTVRKINKLPKSKAKKGND